MVLYERNEVFDSRGRANKFKPKTVEAEFKVAIRGIVETEALLFIVEKDEYNLGPTDFRVVDANVHVINLVGPPGFHLADDTKIGCRAHLHLRIGNANACPNQAVVGPIHIVAQCPRSLAGKRPVVKDQCGRGGVGKDHILV